MERGKLQRVGATPRSPLGIHAPSGGIWGRGWNASLPRSVATRSLEIAYNSTVPIEKFDFIVTDECHRSIYNLWRQVLEYYESWHHPDRTRLTIDLHRTY